ALLRPGRFDRQVLVDRPDINGREAILRIHARGLVLGPDVDLHLIAARTPGFVGADLANVMNEAALLAARQGRDAVGMAEIEEAIDRVVAGLQKKQRVISAREKEIIATHEAGHALVAASLPHTDPVHRISIIPRGIAALGHTMQLPTEDRYLLTRTELLARLAVLLGGRTAEELVFGDCSTGAQDDLQRATELARSMVAEFGMSRGLGLMSFGLHRGAAVWPPYLPAEQPPYSEETARTIDQEVGLLLTETHKLVREILAQQQGLLAEVAARLQEREVLEGDELRALLARARRDWEGAPGRA
ncbi:MAG: cell division protein FtsH, partial [Deltaproteobacteria bacterium]|nr:cell division protein FtsH [Deltaproteobacteria bacterium]